MSIKLIAFDLDGTIFSNTVSEKVKLAFSELEKRKIKILPITGRSLHSTLDILDMAGIKNNKELSVLTTGALVQDLNTKDIKNKNFLKSLDFLKLKKYENSNIHISVYTTKFLYYTTLSEELLNDAYALKDPLRLITDTDFEGDICRINFMGKEEHLNEFKKLYVDELSKDYYVVSNIPTSLEILSKKSSKANGLKFVMDYYGFTKDEVLAIGDGNNDISMFNVVTNSVAMGNASEYVKKHAKYITSSIENDGFYVILKELEII